jgi:hypothetical protein
MDDDDSLDDYDPDYLLDYARERADPEISEEQWAEIERVARETHLRALSQKSTPTPKVI